MNVEEITKVLESVFSVLGLSTLVIALTGSLKKRITSLDAAEIAMILGVVLSIPAMVIFVGHSVGHIFIAIMFGALNGLLAVGAYTKGKGTEDEV